MKTLLRWCAYGVLVVVVAGGVAYVVHGLSGAAAVAQAKQDAAAELAAALPASTHQATRDRDRIRTRVVAAWGRPAYSWQELVCSLDSRDAGWIVQSYTQECQVRSVDLIPVARAKGARCEWLPTPNTTTSGGSGTDPAAEPPPGADIRRGPSTAFDEAHPFRWECPGGILAPTMSGASRLLSGNRPADLDESPAWVVVTVSTDVSSSDLGCDPWTLLFCTEPVDRPVLGNLDQPRRTQ
jgi:hypothetical protein